MLDADKENITTIC